MVGVEGSESEGEVEKEKVRKERGKEEVKREWKGRWEERQGNICFFTNVANLGFLHTTSFFNPPEEHLYVSHISL